MLSALELVGFKSFADKTRFEFGAGITIVVGPNGSGKSNVVDAVKWVLGEQSPKSLRGKEMADVIFNGSARRHALNMAEISLVLDNRSGFLDHESQEVSLTRRVYRSGEGEYLINRQPCRRRDIRDLLAGTGVGAGAYSIIEQGKVDGMLQSSPRERRQIFEEAAGISRFRTKKVETQRRLERVEQNLLRLKDIVDEVDSRLRTVKMQAGKAQRYREATVRLQELRTQVGLVDWRHLTQQLDAFDSELAALREEVVRLNALAESNETQAQELEAQVSEANDSIRESEGRMGRNRERIAALESTCDHQRSLCVDLEQEISRHRRQMAAMNLRAGDLKEQYLATRADAESAAEENRRISARLQESESLLEQAVQSLAALREENEQRREAYMGLMRETAALGHEISALESQAATAVQSQERLAKRIAESRQARDRLSAELSELQSRHEQLAAQLAQQQQEIDAVDEQLEEHRQQRAHCLEELNQLHQKRSGARERADVLSDLEQRQEGLSTGVKQVLKWARSEEPGPYSSVHGVVAELLEVNVQTAPLIEVALGSLVGHLVVDNRQNLLEHLQSSSAKLAGRVGMVLLDASPPLRVSLNLEGRSGVVGRADRLVDTKSQYQPLAARLLGNTWVVEKLSQALSLAEEMAPKHPGTPTQFVTLSGELVRSDGSLVLGPRLGSSGMIARRSELRVLQDRLAELDARIGEVEMDVAALDEQSCQDSEHRDELMKRHQQVQETESEQRQSVQTTTGRLAAVDQQIASLEEERQTARGQQDMAAMAIDAADVKLEAGEAQLAELESVIAEAARQIIALDQDRQQHDRSATTAKVELAKSQERLASLQARLEQFEHDQQERKRTLGEHREALENCARRLQEASRTILRDESELAHLYLHKQDLAKGTTSLVSEREALRKQRTELTEETQTVRKEVHRLEEKIHGQDLAAGQVRLQRTTLADRMREDYGIELAELEHHPTPEEVQRRETVEEEINELRNKINRIGNVNLEALEELEELESRSGSLNAQYEDLAKAKGSLEQIISRINVDSRRLFGETLETVRVHFQDLFRKLFGGGQADIILEEGVDPLEGGVEILARPPGKELRNISLLSGGEKTLTCVALLLSIFRSRPSPFCILDEVDAALDEANIGRFIEVLKDFMQWTQFIVVSHSKKTMSCANTIYGVTMQESGVSKRVSVRFEDVSDNGDFNVAAEESTEAETAPSGDDDDTAAA